MRVGRMLGCAVSLIVLAVAACAIFAALYLPGRAFRDKPTNFTVDGRERSYELHVPATYSAAKPAPLVIALHGRLGNGRGMAKLTHFDRVADDHSFIVAYPDGLWRGWADGRGATTSDKRGVNDMKFIGEMLDRISAQFKIDPARIYVAGMSNGGFMSARLACEMSDRVAAAGIVGATMDGAHVEACEPKHPVSVAFLHGTADELVPEQGGDLGDGSRGIALSLQGGVEKWKALDGCNGAAETSKIPDTTGDGTSIRVERFTGCADGTEVASYVVENGGHTWPGGWQYFPKFLIGRTTRNLDASETLWDFFSRHPMAAAHETR